MGTRVSNEQNPLGIIIRKDKSRLTGEAQISEDKNERNDEGYGYLIQI